jgi:hypothetical protein
MGDGMNDYDKNNLNFLLSLHGKSFNEWADQASEDDIQYAMELLRQRQFEYDLELATVLDRVDDVSQAKKVLSKFRLNK